MRLGMPIGAATAVGNLLGCLYAATPDEWRAGSEWYATAQREAEALGIGLERGAAVIAATSPRTWWARNLEHARAIVNGDEPPAGVLRANDKRGREAYWAGLPALGNGPKVNAFARNIMGDHTMVTVDTWAMRAAMGEDWDGDDPQNVLRRVGAYEWVAGAYRAAAEIVGTSPAMAQAVVWVHARGGAE